MIANYGRLIAEAWDLALVESPSPWDDIRELLLGGRVSYRERLDRQPRNVHGDLIPRIVTVRRNLRRLGKPRHAPRLPA